MTSSRATTYLSQWRATRPSSLISPQFWQNEPHLPLRIHRRILLGRDRGPVPWAATPVQAWTALRWWTRTRFNEFQMPNPDMLALYARHSGIDLRVQAARLAALQRRHGIPPQEALRFGLACDGRFDDWPLFVYRVETGWNISASAEVLGSARVARTQAELLADKVTTAVHLANAGLPVVPTRRVERGDSLSADIAEALLEWDGVFVKPRYGSAGMGAAVATHSVSGIQIRTYQGSQPGTPTTAAEVAGVGPLLLQPLLSSPPWSAEPVSDIVTARIVTRDIGSGPEVFSMVLELPFAAGYSLRSFSDGIIGPDLLVPPGEPSPPVRPEVAEWATDPTLAAAAVTAHRQFPGIFAVAWDVALTTTGPLFLEGNVGFGTLGPQLAAGGLLQGL